MALTDLNLERYSRSILLPEIGGIGQKKIINSKPYMTMRNIG